jgi:hypothetical protein
VKIPKAKPLIISVPKDHNYRIAEGYYTGTIHKVLRLPRPNCRDCEDILRIFCALTVPGMEKFLNLAKAEFPLNLEHGAELRDLLSSLLGKEALAALSGGEYDLESLIGKNVDVQVEHIITGKSEQYDYPFVQICDIKPAGTLAKTTPPAPESTKTETKE